MVAGILRIVVDVEVVVSLEHQVRKERMLHREAVHIVGSGVALAVAEDIVVGKDAGAIEGGAAQGDIPRIGFLSCVPDQGWNPHLLCLLHWQADSLPMYHVSHSAVKKSLMPQLRSCTAK